MRMKLNDWKLIALLLMVVSFAAASFDNSDASGVAPLNDTTGNRLVWLDNYLEALEQSRATGKPIFLEFRCAP
jgi:hypothetical protein